ncbi:MAG TPA: hypothetical protein VH855_00025 [Acetobacteraceae bacterium]|jgi:hypothetical protein
MADPTHLDRLHRAFNSLLQDLSSAWKQDLDYIRDEIAHAEYGDALENLIALGLRNGNVLSPEQVLRIEDLAAAMQLTNSLSNFGKN